MNVLLWILQVLLAAHTVMGALWKFSHPSRSVPSLGAIPHGAWLALGVVELAAALVLVLPAVARSLGGLAPFAALFVVAEMLLYVGVHLASGVQGPGQVVYWLVVAAFSAFIAYGRFSLRPL